MILCNLQNSRNYNDNVVYRCANCPYFGGWSRLSGRIGGQTYNVTWSCKGVKCWSRRTGTSQRYADVNVLVRQYMTEDFYYYNHVRFFNSNSVHRDFHGNQLLIGKCRIQSFQMYYNNIQIKIYVCMYIRRNI